MINSKDQAYFILGLRYNPTKEQIKSQYRILAKKYHPDNGNGYDPKAYGMIKEAYDYLMQGFDNKAKEAKPKMATRIIGDTPTRLDRIKKAEKKRFDDAIKRQREEEQRLAREAIEKKILLRRRREEEYKRTKEAIDLILVAEAIKKMIRDGEKDNY